MDILKTIQEEREAFNALPTSEKIKQNREARVASLLKVGYITPDEAKTYREQLTELPQDRKGLVVAYFLLGIESHLDTIPSTEETKRIEEIIGSFHLSERGALRNGKTIADTLTPEEQSRWSSELSQAHTEEQIRKAETFVDAKRNRIRGQLPPIEETTIGGRRVKDDTKRMAYISSLAEEVRNSLNGNK